MKFPKLRNLFRWKFIFPERAKFSESPPGILLFIYEPVSVRDITCGHTKISDVRNVL
jgi:hypothetical protein